LKALDWLPEAMLFPAVDPTAPAQAATDGDEDGYEAEEGGEDAAEHRPRS
jgi:hypothetical protein